MCLGRDIHVSWPGHPCLLARTHMSRGLDRHVSWPGHPCLLAGTHMSRGQNKNVFWPGHTCLVAGTRTSQEEKNSHATFWRIQPIVPGFVRIVIKFQIRANPGAIGKVFLCFFVENMKISNSLKIARLAPISTETMFLTPETMFLRPGTKLDDAGGGRGGPNCVI